MLNDPRLFIVRRLPVSLKWLVLGWLGAELLVFLLLVHAIGLGATILLGVVTTVIGILVMRRIGAEAMINLRRSVDGRQPPAGAMADGMLAGLGAVLMIIPGFIANLVGLALAAPSVRRKALRVFNGEALPGERPARAPPQGVVDLTPSEWRPVDPP